MSLEDEGVRVIDKIQWRELQSLDVQIGDGIGFRVDESKGVSSSNDDPKVKKLYERRVKKTMSITTLNLGDNQLAHIWNCKGPTVAWKTLCNFHEMRSLSNILFVQRKFSTYKMDEDDDLLDHINEVKALANQRVCLEFHVKF